MERLADYNLFDDATRECPFPCFGAMRREAPAHIIALAPPWPADELDAYYRDVEPQPVNPPVRTRSPST